MATEGIQEANPDYYLDSASGAFDKADGKTTSSLEDVARILDKAAVDKPENGLVIHFHGGLVSRKYALENIVPPLTEGYLTTAKAYPLFFVWQSGLLETLTNNKAELLKDPTFRELVKKVCEFAIKKTTFDKTLTFRGPTGTPIDDLEVYRKQFDDWFDGIPGTHPPVPDPDQAGAQVRSEIPVTRGAGLPSEAELEAEILDSIQIEDPIFKEVMGAAYNAIIPTTEVVTRSAATGTTKIASKVFLSDVAINEMFPPPPNTEQGTKNRDAFTLFKVAKYVAKIVLAVLKRFRDNRDHGIYCTTVEEVLRSAFGDLVGANIWNQMKNDTLQAFTKGEYVGTEVVARLLALKGNGLDKVTLIGHSTGAIYICNFLDAAKSAGLSLKNWQVIFLAPAVTCQRFAQAVDKHKDEGLKNFRMFAMSDELETSDNLVPVLYTRSLLYFVSGLLEGVPQGEGWDSILDMPVGGMQRVVDGNKTFKEDDAVKTVAEFLRAVPERVVWSPKSDVGPGLNSTSAKHGDFDNDPVTLASVYSLIGAKRV